MEKVRSKLKTALVCIGMAVLFIAGSVAGRQMEKNRQEALERQKETVYTIAVVNMDNGIAMGEERINYASLLLYFPNEHFVSTGLSDAKSGIETGFYAAYIVIPETFSETVTSIENNPVKVTLAYQYNSKLSEEAQIQAINDVNEFIAMINSNIAYMYVDAILEEFHRIQDDSTAILASDNTELQRLEAVSAAQLIITAEPVEETVVELGVQPVELASYTDNNIMLLEAMMSGFSEALNEGTDEYALIRETNAAVKTASEDFFLTYAEVLSDTAEEQSKLLEEGQGNLEDAVGTYNQSIEDQREEIVSIVSEAVNEQLNLDQASADGQLEMILNSVDESNQQALNTLQGEWENALGDLEEGVQQDLAVQLENCMAAMDESLEYLIKEAFENGYNCALDNLDAVLDEQGNTDEGDRTEEDTNVENGEVIDEDTNEDTNGNTDENTNEDTNGNIDENTNEDTNENTDENTDAEEITIESIRMLISECRNSGLLLIDTTDYVENINEVKAITGNININFDSFVDIWPEYPADEETDRTDEEDAYTIALSVCGTDMINGKGDQILSLFDLEPDVENIDNVIQTYFIDALFSENQSQMGRLSDVEMILNQRMEDYEYSLISYDPFKYVESANLITYLNDIENNTGDMMNAVEQNNEEYVAYSTDVFLAATENMEQLRASLDEANTQTSVNIENCISDLILSRETANSQNVNMLEGFTNCLAYTRVESQGNSEMYDYIINPVVPQNLGQAVADTSERVSSQNNYKKTILAILFGAGIALCAIRLLADFRRRDKKSPKENEAVF